MLFLLACADRSLTAWTDAPEAIARDQELLRAEAGRAPWPMAPADPKPDIVLIVLDTVRADHLGVYGYDRATSPHLDAWAQGARVYDRMIADAAWTLPSHASLFTGLSPSTHGVHVRRVESGKKVHFLPGTPLPPGTPTLAGALHDAGYRTAGIVANQAFLDPVWGVSQGFDLWMCSQLPEDPRGVPYPPADRITALGKAWLARPSPGPRFLFLNYLDAHAPWTPREGYVRDPSAIDRALLPWNGERWPQVQEALLSRQGVDDATRAAWVEAYDAELRYLDQQLGELLDALPRLGVGPEDWVFVTSDHGESLGEHDLVLHSRDVYDTAVHVPLLVRGPGVTPGREGALTQLHDLPAQILAAAGAAPLPGSARTGGLAVAEQHWARERDATHPAYGARFDRVRRSFRRGDWSLLLGSDGSAELFDLATDPGQTNDVAATQPDTLAALRAAAEAWVAEHPANEREGEEAAGNEGKLRALGYVE